VLQGAAHTTRDANFAGYWDYDTSANGKINGYCMDIDGQVMINGCSIVRD
jgi:hypothetical protein